MWQCPSYDDGDIKPYSPVDMKKLKSIRYPKLLNIKELDDCRNLGCDEVDDMSITEFSDSEGETLHALDQ